MTNILSSNEGRTEKRPTNIVGAIAALILLILIAGALLIPAGWALSFALGLGLWQGVALAGVAFAIIWAAARLARGR